MGRSPCCDKSKVKRGPWSPEEDQTLKNFLEKNGTAGNWISLPHKAGLKRCGKSCRLRWLNYLRPNIKHGAFTEEEDRIICTLYTKIGSRWSIIASKLPGRTDNDVKNHWNTKLKKKLAAAAKNDSNADAKKPFSDSLTNKMPENLELSACLASPKLPFLTDHQEMNGMMMFNTKNIVYDHQIYFSFPNSSSSSITNGGSSRSSATNLCRFSPISQEGSSMSGGSSSLVMEDNNFMAWSGNGGGSVLDQLDAGFPFDHVSHGYQHDEQLIMAAEMWSQDHPELQNLPTTNYNSFATFSDPADTKPQDVPQYCHY